MCFSVSPGRHLVAKFDHYQDMDDWAWRHISQFLYCKRMVHPVYRYTGWPNKFGIIILYALTLPIINLFSKLFHYNNTIDPITPQMVETVWRMWEWMGDGEGWGENQGERRAAPAIRMSINRHMRAMSAICFVRLYILYRTLRCYINTVLRPEAASVGRSRPIRHDSNVTSGDFAPNRHFWVAMTVLHVTGLQGVTFFDLSKPSIY